MSDANPPPLPGERPAGGRRGGRGLFVGRVLGIEFYLDYSWFFIAAIITYTLTVSLFPTWLPGRPPAVYLGMGAIAAFLFFLSIILHELGHSVVSQRCGIPVPRITLLFIGGLAEISREPDDAKSELKIALGGPAVSVVLIGVFALAVWIFDTARLAPPQVVCLWLMWMNIALVVFNMIPGYPLDGGRVLRALLWARTGRLRQATYISSRIGIGFSWVLVAYGVFLVMHLRQWNGFVFFLIAIFLRSAAESGYANALQREVLGDKRVRDIMTPNPITIPASMPASLVVDDFFLTHHHVAFPVVSDDGDFRGLLRLEYLKEIPREKRPYVSAGDLVAEKGSTALSVDANVHATRAMRSLLAPGSGRMAVTDGGRLVGIITRHDVLHFMRIHTELEEQA